MEALYFILIPMIVFAMTVYSSVFRGFPFAVIMLYEVFGGIADIARECPFAEIILEFAHHLVIEIVREQFVKMLDDIFYSLNPFRIVAPISDFVILQLIPLLGNSQFYQAKMIHIRHIVLVKLFLRKGLVCGKILETLKNWMSAPKETREDI